MKRDFEEIANAYYCLLTSLDWNNELLLIGLKEGLNKFLSNLFLKQGGKHKYLHADFYSHKALERVKSGIYSDLVFEHMVPKQKYIQEPCIARAKTGVITAEYILDLLRRYWKIAIITKEEDKLLLSRQMPKDWDGINIFYRYQVAKITLVQSPFIDGWRIQA